MKKLNKKNLDKLYLKYNKFEYIHPDPLEFLYNYKNVRDIEIVGIIASSLAYGRVSQILKSVNIVLKKLGNSPYEFLMKSSINSLEKEFKGFKHRFTTDIELCEFLISIKNIIKKYSSIENCFIEGFKNSDKNIYNSLCFFVKELNFKTKNSIIPDPTKMSACKRLHLFTRWMIRNDKVDLGCWKNIDPAKLIIPLDTHMHKISLALDITKRKIANLVTSIEITERFKEISKNDPVKYDFCLTRFGIRDEMNYNDLIKLYGMK